jgi:hypothetical protein
MPLTKLQFRPGINKETTSYANEGGYFECDKVRFRSGSPEKIGGWINQSPAYTFKGVARLLWNWVTLASANLLAIGTSQKFYIEYGGDYYDITPLRLAATTLGANPIATVSGSRQLTITHVAHAASVGTYVTLTSTVAVGGITVAGEYEILTTPSGNTYTIASDIAASSTTTGGGTVTAEYQINAGSSTYTLTGGGWGTGAWGEGGWGEAVGIGVGIPLRLWSSCNYGEDLLMAPRGGEIYYWHVDTGTFARAVPLSTRTNTLTKTSTSASFTNGLTSITVGSATGITAGQVIAGTNIPVGTYVTAAYALGSTTVPISAPTTGTSSGTYTFSYAGRFVPTSTNQIFNTDVSHFTVALGANPYDPTNFATAFDPMLVRWSDQDNTYEWVPEATNQAGEQPLSNGSALVCAHNTRQEILVWSDTALYSMQYLGPPYVFSFNMIAENLSIASPKAVTTASGITRWMGTDKFYLYSGRVEPIPCTLRKFVFDNINREQMFQIVSGTNEGFNESWWFYPSANSVINDSYVIYNHVENIWYYGTLSRTAWLDSPLRRSPMGAFSLQTSYLSADLDSTATTLTLLDGSSYPATGTVVIGTEQISYEAVSGNTLTGCVRGVNLTTATSHDAYSPATFLIPNQVMFHEYETDDQSGPTATPIEAFIESSDFDIGDGHNYAFVWRVMPDLSFNGSTVEAPQVLLMVEGRENSGTAYPPAAQPVVARSAAIPIEQYTGEVYTRVRGRQMKFRLDSTRLGVHWQMGAMRIDVRPDGRR